MTKTHVEARLFQTKKGKNHLLLHVELFLKDGQNIPRRLEGTRRDIMARLPALLEPLTTRLVESEIQCLAEETASSKRIFENRRHISFRILPSQTIDILTQLASRTTLSWQGKPILFDMVSKPRELEATIDRGEVSLSLRTGGERISCPHDSLFFFMALPHLILHGTILQRLHEDISWRSLKIFLDGSSRVIPSREELAEWHEVVEADEQLQKVFRIPKNVLPVEEQSLSLPLPILRFHDTRGCIASLFMEYPGEGRWESRLALYMPDLASEEEAFWEQDLLSSGFERTTFESREGVVFRYFCPLEKVNAALELLLSVGWRLLDAENRPVVRARSVHLEVHEETQNAYRLRSRVEGEAITGWDERRFFEALSQMRETSPPFLSMGDYILFLPPEQCSSLTCVSQEIELSPEGALISSLKRGLFGQPERAPALPPISPQFHGILRPYQKVGVGWIQERWEKREPCLLADEMGLGKTVQVLAWLGGILSQGHRALIIAPKSLLFNWEKECAKFLPTVSTSIYRGEGCESVTSHHPIIISSYHTVRSHADVLKQISFSCVIVDEAQCVKNPESLGFEAIAALSKEFMILLTGTPLENSMKDIWSLFHLFPTQLFHDLRSFMHSFPTQKVRKIIAPFLLRRTKNMVAKELPELIEEIVFVSMDQEEKRRYATFIQLLKERKVYKGHHAQSRMEILEAITRLRQIVCHHELFQFMEGSTSPTAKWELFLTDLTTSIAEGKKVLIFSQFRQIIDKIVLEARDVRGWRGVSYHGKSGVIEDAVQAFQDDPSISFFATTMKSGGTGLNLTAADVVLIYDPWWNHASEAQAIARAHRIGRTSSVIVKRYITHESIEERVYEIGQRKKALFHHLFSSSDTEDADAEVHDELIVDLLDREIESWN